MEKTPSNHNLEEARRKALFSQAVEIERASKKAIESLNQLQKKSASVYRNIFLWVLLVVLSLLIVVFYAVRIEVRGFKAELEKTKSEISLNEKIILKQQQTIDRLHLLGGNANLAGCRNYDNGKIYPCVQVYGGTRSNGEYAMLYDPENVKNENLR